MFRTARQIFRLPVWAAFLLLAGPVWSQTAKPVELSTDSIAATINGSSLVYVSDYFSFVGSDTQGRVAFALDNNRGRDGNAYQAEHFLVLHDENAGWIPVQGNGAYDNSRKELIGIPDSRHFRFQGSTLTGLTIHGSSNALTLKIHPIVPHTVKSDLGGSFWLGSAPAVLTWQGRTLVGRVIFEYFMKPDFNRLTRKYFGYWKDFHGLYLLAGRDADFYLHTHRNEKGAELNGNLLGFFSLPGETHVLAGLTVDVTAREQALGFYRWPVAWSIHWQGKSGAGGATLRIYERNKIANWVMGGFSMGIVKGEVTLDGQTYQVYGLGELII